MNLENIKELKILLKDKYESMLLTVVNDQKHDSIYSYRGKKSGCGRTVKMYYKQEILKQINKELIENYEFNTTSRSLIEISKDLFEKQLTEKFIVELLEDSNITKIKSFKSNMDKYEAMKENGQIQEIKDIYEDFCLSLKSVITDHPIISYLDKQITEELKEKLKIQQQNDNKTSQDLNSVENILI